MGLELPECVGQRPGGGAVDCVAALGPGEQDREDRTVAFDPDGVGHEVAPTARRTKVLSAARISSVSGCAPATGDRGPTSTSPQPPTSAAAVSSALWPGTSPASTAAFRVSATSDE